jgi:hypothetical protein
MTVQDAGYECEADYQRLVDLLPKTEDRWLSAAERAGASIVPKDALHAKLGELGIKAPFDYDPGKASKRNERKRQEPQSPFPEDFSDILRELFDQK